jgi:hypothetical protein
MARLKEGKRVNLRKEKKRSHKVILNILTVGNKDIIRGITIRNLNKTEQPK